MTRLPILCSVHLKVLLEIWSYCLKKDLTWWTACFTSSGKPAVEGVCALGRHCGGRALSEGARGATFPSWVCLWGKLDISHKHYLPQASHKSTIYSISSGADEIPGTQTKAVVEVIAELTSFLTRLCLVIVVIIYSEINMPALPWWYFPRQ